MSALKNPLTWAMVALLLIVGLFVWSAYDTKKKQAERAEEHRKKIESGEYRKSTLTPAEQRAYRKCRKDLRSDPDLIWATKADSRHEFCMGIAKQGD